MDDYSEADYQAYHDSEEEDAEDRLYTLIVRLNKRVCALERLASRHEDRLDNVERLAEGIEHTVLAMEEKTRDMRYGE